MSIDPFGPLGTTPAEIQADKNQGYERRIAALERRPLLNMASWQEPTLLNGFANVGGDYAPAGYYLDGAGRVYLRGRLTAPEGAGSGELVFTLREGYRPVFVHEFTVVSGGGIESGPVWASVTVEPSGDVTFAGSQIEQFPIDSVAFRRI